jgi:phosphoadenylyl-sulfate reductase (thioredoxin)
VAVVSSFGAESAVLLHLVAQVDPATPVLFLDTHKHFPETLAYRDALVAQLGLTNLIVLEPDAAVVAKKDEAGLRWSWDPDGCCEIRKVVPLARAMAGFDASITGRKGFQSATRAGLPRFEIDSSDAAGRLKINPLASWTKDRLDAYFTVHGLPRHPLVDQGYPRSAARPAPARSRRAKTRDRVAGKAGTRPNAAFTCPAATTATAANFRRATSRCSRPFDPPRPGEAGRRPFSCAGWADSPSFAKADAPADGRIPPLAPAARPNSLHPGKPLDRSSRRCAAA